jgi:hypothetical protein
MLDFLRYHAEDAPLCKKDTSHRADPGSCVIAALLAAGTATHPPK